MTSRPMPAKILIADDEALIVKQLAAFLTTLGYQVETASDGYSVVTAFHKMVQGAKLWVKKS